MAWNSTTLAGSAGAIATKAQEAIAVVQTGLSALGVQIAAMDDKVSEATTAANELKSKLSALEESGFYMITLSPKVGAWDFRLDTALNEPHYEPHLFSAGTATIVIMPSMAEAQKAYQGIKSLLAATVHDVASLIPVAEDAFQAPDLPGAFEKPTVTTSVPDLDDLFQTDVWKGANLGDVFGGKKAGLSQAAKAQVEAGERAFNATNSMKKRSAGLNRSLQSVSEMIEDSLATGAYNITLGPGRGRYLTRLVSEAGSPPTDSDLVTCGFVCIAVAGTLAEVIDKFAKLTEALDA